jgi:hypothetical protein
MLDRRSEMIYPETLNDRSTLDDVPGIVKICYAALAKFGKESAIVFQKPSISLLFIS